MALIMNDRSRNAWEGTMHTFQKLLMKSLQYEQAGQFDLAEAYFIAAMRAM